MSMVGYRNPVPIRHRFLCKKADFGAMPERSVEIFVRRKKHHHWHLM